MRHTLGPLLLVSVALLAGCAPEAPAPSPTPVAPRFDSDADALAAAEEAYSAYLEVVDELFRDGGTAPERLLEVASQEVLDAQLDGYREMREQGARGVGSATFVLTLRSYSGGEVLAFSCDDISATDVLGPDGSSIVSDKRQVLLPYEVTFTGTPLLVASREIWKGQGACA